MIEIKSDFQQHADRFQHATRQLDRLMHRAILRSVLKVERHAKRVAIQQGGYTRGPRGGKIPTPAPRWPHVYARTGDLRRHVTHVVSRDHRGWKGAVGTPLKKGKWLEEGTTHGIRARQWLKRSYEANRQYVRGEITKALQEVMRTMRR